MSLPMAPLEFKTGCSVHSSWTPFLARVAIIAWKSIIDGESIDPSHDQGVAGAGEVE